MERMARDRLWTTGSVERAGSWRGRTAPVPARGVTCRSPDAAAQPIPIEDLYRGQPAHIAPLWGSGRRAVLSAFQPATGTGLLGDSGRGVIPAVHRDHVQPVALGRRPGEPLRRAPATHGGAADHGDRILSLLGAQSRLQLPDQLLSGRCGAFR